MRGKDVPEKEKQKKEEPGKGKQDREKRKRRAIVLASVLFYSAMLFLALGARRMHEGGLPQVTVTTPTIKIFGEGDTVTAVTALPEKIVDGGALFLLSETIINGEIRMVAREVTELEIGRVSDGYREILNGVHSLSQVIVDGKEELRDGDEVLVKGEWVDDGK